MPTKVRSSSGREYVGSTTSLLGSAVAPLRNVAIAFQRSSSSIPTVTLRPLCSRRKISRWTTNSSRDDSSSNGFLSRISLPRSSVAKLFLSAKHLHTRTHSTHGSKSIRCFNCTWHSSYRENYNIGIDTKLRAGKTSKHTTIRRHRMGSGVG